MGVAETCEYANTKWYIDIWLTIVWVSYLAVYVGTRSPSWGSRR